MRSQQQRFVPLFFAVLITFVLLSGPLVMAGRLEPTDPPGPTMKTLDEVEPRIPISQEDIPLTVTESGSYYLAEHLSVTASGVHAISIAADNVTVDLMGYTITGPDAGTGNGIYAPYENVEVRNGTIRDFYDGIYGNGAHWRVINVKALSNLRWGIIVSGYGNVISGCTVNGNGAAGLVAGTANSIRKCIAVNNGDRGMVTQSDCTVEHCTFVANSDRGIQVQSGCIVSNCVAENNKQGGINAFSACKITGNACRNNAGVGILAGEGNLIKGNTVRGSGSHGLAVTNGCTVIENTVFDNSGNGINSGSSNTLTGNTAYGNQAYGIAGLMGCIVTRNVARNNTSHGIYVDHNCTVTWNNCYNNGLNGDGAGIRASSGNRIESNQLTENDRGIELDSTMNLVVKNTSRGDVETWTQRVPGNQVAPWSQNPTTAGPWDNFQF